MDILKKITDMRLEKGWTEYELAERSELTQSTISSLYRKNITKEQMEILNRWSRLTKDQRKKLADFLDSIR